MKEKLLKLCDIIEEDEAAKVFELLQILINNIEDEELNVCTEIKDFKLKLIYKILSAFKDEE